jgi:protein-S-isoprenylcysteine O-methyltransferase Ste14
MIHATRGAVRDQNTRRKAMFGLILAALVLLFSGLTFLASTLNPHEHPRWFILFWIFCLWLTLTAMLLAIFDLLMVRLEGQGAQRRLRENLKTTDSFSSTTPKRFGSAKDPGID